MKLNNEQLLTFNKLKNDEKCATDEIIYSKSISINTISQDFIEMPLDSLHTEEVEAFIGIGLVLNGKSSLEGVDLFRTQNTHPRNIVFLHNGIWNIPLMYFNVLNNDFFERLGIPYFEFVEVKPNK